MFQQKSIILVLIFFVFGSCSQETLVSQLDIQGQSGFNYTQSKNAWQDLKKENGNSYEYTIQEMSWTGRGSRTLIVIENGKVISRNYNAYFRDDNSGEEEITDSFYETGAELGNHQYGARPLTIDELYEICVSEYLIADVQQNTVYFDTDDAGILNTCGYVPKECIDDCFKGITISHFAWL